MNGQIGVLRQNGKQVGGIYDWMISLVYDSTVNDGWEKFKVIKHITAQSYWLVVIPSDNIFDIELYKKIEGQLVLVDAGEVGINLPDTETLDRKLYAPLELVWRKPSEY